MSRRFRVGVVGATGIAGQQFVVALQHHPWFSIERLAASERSAGKRFGQALLDPKTGARRWWCADEPTDGVLAIPVENGDTLDPDGLDVVFSATEADVARVQEPRFAKTTAVLSTASAFRYESDVPLLVPNVNMDHAALIHRQRETRGWKGFVVPIPNCTVTGLVITLKPLRHTESVFASLRRRASVADVKQAFASARNETLELGLPTAPTEWIKVHDDPFRPQPRLDRDNGEGMTTTVGRIREDNVLPNGVKYMLVSHNTRMGAAAGAVLVAEYLAVKGYLDA